MHGVWWYVTTGMGYGLPSMVWEGLYDWLEQKLQSKRGVKGATKVKKGVRREVVQGRLLVHDLGVEVWPVGLCLCSLLRGEG